MRKTISIIVPLCNEEQNIPLIYDALKKVWEDLSGYDYEFIFVNDGSSDRSGLAVEMIALKDKKVRYIDFSRNFGKEAATTAGLKSATGDAVILIDADLQHPPELIPEFVRKWEEGSEVVVGVRTKNNGESFIGGLCSRWYYRIMGFISETEIKPGETDFRLLDRQVLDAFNSLTERSRMTRALINWLGFRREFVEFVAPDRVHGEAVYSYSKLFHLAVYSFISHSLLPLRLAGYIGTFIAVLSGIAGSVIFFVRYILNDPWSWHISNIVQLAILNAFLIGLVLMSLGIMALYIATIHSESLGRPMYVIRSKKL